MKFNYPKYIWGQLDVVRPGFWLKSDRWPWQERKSLALMSSDEEVKSKHYGWRPTKGTGRFGGGWNWKLGVSIGNDFRSFYFDLLFGTLSFGWRTRAQADDENKWARERYERQFGKEDTTISATMRRLAG